MCVYALCERNLYVGAFVCVEVRVRIAKDARERESVFCAAAAAEAVLPSRLSINL